MCRSLIRLELLSSFVEPNTLQCFRFNLTDTFTRDAEFAADFFKGEADAFVGEAVAHFEDFTLWEPEGLTFSMAQQSVIQSSILQIDF